MTSILDTIIPPSLAPSSSLINTSTASSRATSSNGQPTVNPLTAIGNFLNPTYPSIPNAPLPAGYSFPNSKPTPPPTLPTTINSTNTAPTTPLSVPVVTTPPNPITTALATNSPAPVYPKFDPNTGQALDPNTGQPLPTDANAGTKAKLSTLIDQYGNKGADTQALYDQYNIPGLQTGAVAANNAYLKAQADLNQRLESIRTTPGMSPSGAQQAIDAVNKEQSANVANYAIAAQAATGNLQAVQNIVDSKIKNQYQPIADQIGFLGNFIQTNNANLTDSQKTQLENQRFQLQTQYSQLITANTNAHSFLVQNGLFTPAIGAKLDQAKSLSEIAQIQQDAVSGSGMMANGNNTTSNDGQPIKLSDGTQVTNPASISKVSSIPAQFQQYVTGGPKGLVYIDASRMSNASTQVQNQVQQYANNAGIPVLDANSTAGVQSLDVTFKSLDAMGQLADTALSSGLIGRVKGLTINSLAQQFQTGKDVTDPITGNQVPLGVLLGNFDQYRDSAIKAVQALAGGQGSGLKLNTGTIETAANNLPTSKDSLESAKVKLSTFQSLLTRQLSEKFPEIKPENQVSGNIYNF